jgi:hypothetical protein
MLPRLLKLTSNSNGYWIWVQTVDGIMRIFPAEAARSRAFSAQSISPRAGAANANNAKVTAINAIALRANDQ